MTLFLEQLRCRMGDRTPVVERLIYPPWPACRQGLVSKIELKYAYEHWLGKRAFFVYGLGLTPRCGDG
jgi:hypothetical protein